MGNQLVYEGHTKPRGGIVDANDTNQSHDCTGLQTNKCHYVKQSQRNVSRTIPIQQLQTEKLVTRKVAIRWTFFTTSFVIK